MLLVMVKFSFLEAESICNLATFCSLFTMSLFMLCYNTFRIVSCGGIALFGYYRILTITVVFNVMIASMKASGNSTTRLFRLNKKQWLLTKHFSQVGI
ncbi:hypothetical protein L1987_32330 [Smallanthus sonchifolius]|uniref:Uncharacterized protein n=1 Tax=Smallanthus sonchifolius TaxID=185202 RepID=A0ACB9I7V8_9ASTR|nr:hypothetical protein L1987_32330 [Smallanthus sonchifolius]